MHERLGQALQDHPVELGLVPADHEHDVLALGGGDVAHGAGKLRGDRGERKHAHLDRGVLQVAEEPAAQIELVGDRLVVVAALDADHVLEPAAVENGLGHEVEQTVDLLRRHANPAPVGGRRSSDRRVGFDRCLGFVGEGAGHASREVVEQAGRRLVVTCDVSSQRVRAAQQRCGEVRGEGACRASFRKNVLDDVRKVSYRVQPEHRGSALDRVRVAKERVDRLGVGAASLELEQGVDHAVEPAVRLVAKEGEKLGFGV